MQTRHVRTSPDVIWEISTVAPDEARITVSDLLEEEPELRDVMVALAREHGVSLDELLSYGLEQCDEHTLH